MCAHVRTCASIKPITHSLVRSERRLYSKHEVRLSEVPQISLKRSGIVSGQGQKSRVSEETPTRKCSGDKSDGRGKEPVIFAEKGPLEIISYLKVRA